MLNGTIGITYDKKREAAPFGNACVTPTIESFIERLPSAYKRA
jgi:hypothetical protein